jgi:hypothetical protein
MRIRITSMALVAALSAGASAGTWVTSETAFLAALVGPHYKEEFNSFTLSGSPLSGNANWVAPGGNGYGFTASSPNGLWSAVGALSTLFGDDSITLTFSGAPVSAFGAFVTNSDISENPIPGAVEITLSNQAVQTVGDGQSTGYFFLGWIGDDANDTITSATLQSNFNLGFDFVQIDAVYVGAVPEPGTIAALGVGAAALLRRRNRKA